jgi:glycosyltransferase involved in cell wall biosynthesis
MSLPSRPLGPTNSLVIPVYKNEPNIPDLLEALRDLHHDLNGDLEVVLVVDGSPDRSWPILRDALRAEPYQSQLLLLSRNFGSFAAIRRGLEVARGRSIAVMAADLQEPTSVVRTFFRLLQDDEADVALGVRESRSDGLLTRLASNAFWMFYRRYVVKEMPAGGVDVFACTSRARDDLLLLGESNTSLVSQVLWIGGRRVHVPYARQLRRKGRSAWTLAAKIRYMLDSVMAFSDLPIYLLLWLGLIGVAVSLSAGLVVFVAWIAGAITVPGYTPVMLLVSMIGSLTMLSQGIIGSYVWRANENTKHRPLSLVRSHEHFTPGRPATSRAECDIEVKPEPSGRVGVP